MMRKFQKQKGFTLIELMVASSIFVMVMLIMAGAVTSIFTANQKSKTLRSVMDNLNLTLESMTRNIRFSKNYHCGSTGTLSLPNDCSTPSSSLTVTNSSGSQVTYSLSSGRIMRTSGGNSYYITAPDITISSLRFIVSGSNPFVSGIGVTCATTDCFQPRVVITIKGSVGNRADYTSTFGLETVVTQRSFDFQ